MRRSIAIGGMVVAAMAQAGCFFVADFDDCSLYPARACLGSTTSSGAGGSGGHGGGGGGGDGGLPPECQGEPSEKNVTDACGVFAQADAPAGGDGSKAKPLAKLGDAIAKAESEGKRVYACAGAAFTEAVTISAGLELYGGLDCANGWGWSKGLRAALNGPADAIVITVGQSAGGARIDGFVVQAASPSDMKGGGSSLAVVVADVKATIERCDVKASDAADGVDGQTPTVPAMKGADALPPDALTMNACVLPASVAGGAPGLTTCDDGDTSGGKGGRGGITGTNNGNGDKGADATPLPNPNPTMAGVGGVGQTDLVNVSKFCQDGDKGLPGSSGAAGPGGSANGDTLSMSGIENTEVTDGKAGTRAQGGGGGGGAKSGMFCGGGVDGPGASGGGGGGGGCGGKGGGGGKRGGSTIGILSLSRMLTVAEVTIAVGTAGKGGGGAAGQTGGDPGVGAVGGAKSVIAPSASGCKGGDGGVGGPGGPGGGGRGGHAIGMVFAQGTNAAPMVTSFTPGAPGDGGAGGLGAPSTSHGEPGHAGQCWDFMTQAACK